MLHLTSSKILMIVFQLCFWTDLSEQQQHVFQNVSQNLMMCYSKSPINMSDDICGDLCEKGAACSKESGACICFHEPTPTSLGGHFTHCTNWNYVEQLECKGMCQGEGKTTLESVGQLPLGITALVFKQKLLPIRKGNKCLPYYVHMSRIEYKVV